MLKRLLSFMAPHWLAIRVIATFVTLIALFFSLLTYEPIVSRIDLGALLAQLSARLSWVLLRGLAPFVGYSVQLDGTNLASSGFRVEVSPACSGAVPMMIYLAAVLAYPTNPRAKMIGTGMGLGIIHVVNLMRIVALFLIGLYFKEYFHDTHVYVAQALVVAIAVVTWLFWAGRFTDAPGH